MSLPQDIEKLTKTEIEAFLDSFDYVLSDCDGVIWQGNEPLSDVGKFFEYMKKQNKNVAFVSNNSLRSEDAYKKLFKAAGIDNGVNNLTYPSKVIAEYLKQNDFNKSVFCVTAPECRKTLESFGFKCKEGPLIGEEIYTDFVKYLEDDPEIGAVVFDSDFRVNLPKLYMATTYLRRKEVHFISGATDNIVPLRDGKFCLGPGKFTDMVSELLNRNPIVLAKPGKPFAEYVMKWKGITDPKRVLFIGDMIIQDIGFGKTAGFSTLLVMTGHTSEDMMKNVKLWPDYFAPNLSKVLARLPE